MSNDTPESGSKTTYNGEDFYALKTDDQYRCRLCWFSKDNYESRMFCSQTPCKEHVWLPLKVYITRKLTT